MNELTINVNEAKSKLKNCFLLDVRSLEEYKIAKINGAKLIPLDELESRMNELPKNKEIIIYCHHGMRSLQAAMFLKEHKFNVKSISGGIDEWAKSIDRY